MNKSQQTLEAWLKYANNACSTQNPNAPSLIVQKVLKLSKTEQITKKEDFTLSPKQLAKLNNLLGRLLKGRPLGQVLGSTDFHNIKLKINSKVLSPRAETEVIVDYAIQNLPQNAKLIDLGTGSGAIALAIFKARLDLDITLTDTSEHNLKLAKRNARFNRLGNPYNLNFLRSSLIKKIDQTFLHDSFFLANLPYLNKNWIHLKHRRLKHEPSVALFAGRNGLEIIFELLESLKKNDLLNKTNWLLLEHDPSQFNELEAFAVKLGYCLTQISPFVSLVKNT